MNVYNFGEVWTNVELYEQNFFSIMIIATTRLKKNDYSLILVTLVEAVPISKNEIFI